MSSERTKASEGRRPPALLGRRRFARWGLALLGVPALPGVAAAHVRLPSASKEGGPDEPGGARDGDVDARTSHADAAAAVAPTDPLTVLYGRRLAFENGEPHVSVRILEGERSFSFVPRGRLTVTTRGTEGGGSGADSGSGAGRPTSLHAPAGGTWTVRLRRSKPGRAVVRVQVGEHRFQDAEGARAEAEFFRDHGYTPLLVSAGTVYGIAGRTVDTRRILVLLEADGSEGTARKRMAEIESRFGGRPSLHREPMARSTGEIEVVGPDGVVLARSPDALTLDVADDQGLVVKRVEHGMGYAHHGHEDRTYRGRVYAVIDARGRLAAVNLVSLEQLARGIVPSEIFAASHPEALKAQAVTARGEILAKVGSRHLGDPYLLCAEQHCQVYRGASGEDPRTDAAVEATRGEALFSAASGTLVPSYYSAICGGHTEDNDAVWGGPADASIRGRPDFPVSDELAIFREGIGDALLRRWLNADVPSYCRTASLARPSKYRWSRSFTQAEVDAIAAPYGVGRVTALEVEGRGISGRAKSLVIRGTKGEAKVHTELSIRRLFRMLESGMFVIDTEGEGADRRWHFRGGGWGHGAGMCQTGAIGRAEQGATYREILGHYFNGAVVTRMY